MITSRTLIEEHSISFENVNMCVKQVSGTLRISEDDALEILFEDNPWFSMWYKAHTLNTCALLQEPDKEVVLFYFSGSKNARPGHGAGEKIPKEKEADFVDLERIDGWRKMLSNFYISPFLLDGEMWNSVEHYYQGSKFAKSHPDFVKLFTMGSCSDISKCPLVAKSAGGKSGKSKGKQLRPVNITMDSDFFSGNACSINMFKTFERRLRTEFKAMYAKFSQHPNLKEMLLATNNATLTHGTRGVPTKPVYTLMKVREILRM